MNLLIINDLSKDFEKKSLEQHIDDNKSDNKVVALSTGQIVQVMEQLGKIDWNELQKTFNNEAAILGGLVALEDVAKIIVPFVPQAAMAAVVLAAIVEIIKNTHPVDPYNVPGYHWDMLEGWVPDTQGE